MRLSLRTPLALTAGLASLALAAPAMAAPATVDVGDNYFAADNVTVNVGDAVTWNWTGGGHNVAFQSGPEQIAATAFNNKGATWSHTFTKAGTYTYICEAHSKMKATVTVVDAGQPAAPGQPAAGPGAPSATPGATGNSSQPVSGPAGLPSAGIAGVDAAAPTVDKLAFRKGALRLNLSEAAKLTVRYVMTDGKAHTVVTRRLTAKKGQNSFSMRRWMRRGHYRVSIVAIDGAGNASKPARLKLAVRR